MSQHELLVRVVRVLDSAHIPYMVTGSVASSMQGQPRATHDIDLVVMLTKSSVDTLIESFHAPEFFLDKAGILNAIDESSMFNLVDEREGDKVDFWMLTDKPFDRSRFGRRKLENMMGVDVLISAPEDTILAKLKWSKESGGSEKHFADALRVFEVQQELLDMQYLESWVGKLGLQELWWRLTERAELP